MKRILVLALMLISTVAYCEQDEIKQGEIIRQSGDRYAIECSYGLVLVEWHGGYYPKEGDIYAGRFLKHGMHEFYCPTSDQMTKFLVHDYMCSEIKMYEYLFE